MPVRTRSQVEVTTDTVDVLNGLASNSSMASKKRKSVVEPTGRKRGRPAKKRRTSSEMVDSGIGGSEKNDASKEILEEMASSPATSATDSKDGRGKNGEGSNGSQIDEGEDDEEFASEIQSDEGEGDVRSFSSGYHDSENDEGHAQRQRPQSRAEAMADLYDCGKYWTTARNAAKYNQRRGTPLTAPGQRLSRAINACNQRLGESATQVPHDGAEALEATALEEIATAIGDLRKDASRSGDREKRLLRDIYLHVIPQAVNLLWSLLLVRSSSGGLDNPALEELIMMLKVICQLCERVYRWKPKPLLQDNVKSRTNNKIKLSLKQIWSQYDSALSNLQAAELERQESLREERHAHRRAMNLEASHRKIEARRRLIENEILMDQRADGYKWQQPMQRRVQDQHSNCFSREHSSSQHERILSTRSRFGPEAIEEISQPGKRLWRNEETIALLLLLQRYREPDRYLRIQEHIGEISREIRKLGADKFLGMAGRHLDISLDSAAETLDALGEMSVNDIARQARYLKSAQAERIEREIRVNGDRTAWDWLLSV